MIKRFIRRVLGLPPGAPLRVPREKHHLARGAISQGALKTCDGLRQAGFEAYVVGGAVRDLLLGIEPKDYDVATDARPEQVKPLFRRALLIGRRFRLVHVMVGQETVEVSTFRAADPETAEKNEHGRVLRDNVFGTQEEDARRRDFTVNALYFDPASEEIVDYHGGLADLRKRVLRMIGDPKPASAKIRYGCCARCAWAPSSVSRSTRRLARRSAARAAARAGAAGAAVRRDAQAAALRPRQRLPAAAARGWAASGAAAAARRDPRAAAWRALRHACAGANRRTGEHRPPGVSRIPFRSAAMARGAGGVEGPRRRAASARCRRWNRRWTTCWRHMREARHHAQLTSTMREIWRFSRASISAPASGPIG